jgi:curli production assembly/transport component CsgE
MRIAKFARQRDIADDAMQGDRLMRNQRIHAVIAVAVAALSQLPAFAQDDTNSDRALNASVLQELYAGVVVDQTVTVVGHDFYQEFVALWREKDMSSRYAIAVIERPSARWGSQIWIEYAHRRVFQIFLPAARANVRAASAEAADAAFQNVVDAEVQRLLFRDPDLGADEI